MWYHAVPGCDNPALYNVNTRGAGTPAFNPNTGRFTAPVGGYFMCSASVRINDNEKTYVRLLMAVNGDLDVNKGFSAISGNANAAVRTLSAGGSMFLNAGDYVSLHVYSHEDADYTVSHESGFSCHLLAEEGDVTVGFHADLAAVAAPTSLASSPAWATSEPYRWCSVRAFRGANGFTLASCKAKCLEDAQCTAIFGNMHLSDNAACWTCYECTERLCPRLMAHASNFQVHYRPAVSEITAKWRPAARNDRVVATGGAVTTVNGKKVHTFTCASEDMYASVASTNCYVSTQAGYFVPSDSPFYASCAETYREGGAEGAACRMAAGASVAECKAICSAHEACTAFVYNSAGDPTNCWFREGPLSDNDSSYTCYKKLRPQSCRDLQETFTFDVSSGGKIEYLIAAGGGGGTSHAGGGGGGGGVLTGTMVVKAGRVYTVNVGAGGHEGRVSTDNDQGHDRRGGNGKDSSFGDLVAQGGGGGGGFPRGSDPPGSTNYAVGWEGGSGGGGSRGSQGGKAAANQGYPGGGSTRPPETGAGGGGAGGAGSMNGAVSGGSGGAGKASLVSGTEAFYGGGGGGGGNIGGINSAGGSGSAPLPTGVPGSARFFALGFGSRNNPAAVTAPSSATVAATPMSGTTLPTMVARGGVGDAGYAVGFDQGASLTYSETIPQSYHWVVIGDSIWEEDEEGNKYDECKNDLATHSVQSNSYGNKLGVRCCKDNGSGASPDCNEEKTYAEAWAICDNWGGRLCTKTELEANQAEGTGCSFDAYLVWSSTPCVGDAWELDSGGDRTFLAWYKGEQTQTCQPSSWTCGVPIFGDSTGGWSALGLQAGKAAVCNGGTAKGAGTTNVADGEWHMLAWVLDSNSNGANDGSRCFHVYADPDGIMTDEAQVCGPFECCSGTSSNCNSGTEGSCDFNVIGTSYDYGYGGSESLHDYCSNAELAAGPSALDDVQVFSAALTTAQLQDIRDRSKATSGGDGGGPATVGGDGAPNSGGGGGGGGREPNARGGRGGSGVVIISYPDIAAGGVDTDPTLYSVSTVKSDLLKAEAEERIVFHLRQGEAGSTTFTDATGRHAIIHLGGDVEHKSDQKKIGGTSIYFKGGDDDDCLQVPDSPDWAFGMDDFSIDLWFRAYYVTRDHISFFQHCEDETGTSTHKGFMLGLEDDKLRWFARNGNGDLFKELNHDGLDRYTWYHVIALRSGNAVRLYLDGETVESNHRHGSMFYGEWPDYAGPVTMGCRPEEDEFRGWIDELRVHRGTARFPWDLDLNGDGFYDVFSLPLSKDNSAAYFYENGVETPQEGVGAAEHVYSIVGDNPCWQRDSGWKGDFIRLREGAFTGSSCNQDAYVSIPFTCAAADSNVKFAAQVVTPDGGSNSMKVAVDGGSTSTWYASTESDWATSDNSPGFSVTAGQHELKVYPKEDGVKFKDIKFGSATYGGDTCAFDHAICKTCTDGGPSGAFDYLRDEAWNGCCQGYPQQTLRYGPFDKPQVVVGYSLMTASGECPTAWSFEGSLDANTWTTLDSQTGQACTDKAFVDYTFANTVAFIHFQWKFTAAIQGGAMNADGIRIYGVNILGAQVGAGGFDPSTGRFTAPVEGHYVCSAQARFDVVKVGGKVYSWAEVGAGTVKFSLGKNGDFSNGLSATMGSPLSSDYHSIHVSGSLFLRAGDYVSLAAQGTAAAGNLISHSGTDFSVMSTYSGMSFTRVQEAASPSGYAAELKITDTDVSLSARVRFGSAADIPTSGTGYVSVWAKSTSTGDLTIPSIHAGVSGDPGWYPLLPVDGGSPYLTPEFRKFAAASVEFGTASGGPNPGFSITHYNNYEQGVAGDGLDTVASGGNSGSCDCDQFCAANWHNNVKAARPHWRGATSWLNDQSGPTCTCLEATHWCEVAEGVACASSCASNGVAVPLPLKDRYTVGTSARFHTPRVIGHGYGGGDGTWEIQETAETGISCHLLPSVRVPTG